MSVICSGAKVCKFPSCKHYHPHDRISESNGSVCKSRKCSLAWGAAIVMCVAVSPNKKSVGDIMPKTIKITPTDKREIMKSLNLYQTVWYHQIPCFIDCLHSKEGFTGKGDLRIVPEDKQLHMKGTNTLLQCAGKWIDIDEVAFSIHPPPVEITWKNTKGSKCGIFDFNKAKKIGTLLAEGSTLLVKRLGFNNSHVKMDEAGTITVHDIELDEPMAAYNSSTVRKLMMERLKGDTWLIVHD